VVLRQLGNTVVIGWEVPEDELTMQACGADHDAPGRYASKPLEMRPGRPR